MNLEELEEELENVLPPGFTIETDRKGRVIIITNFQLDDDGELEPFESDEEEEADEEDLEVDPDFEPLEDEDDEEEL